MLPSMTPEERFERSRASIDGSKAASRIDFYGGSNVYADPVLARRLRSPGDFLSRLWARFGPPASVVREGFEYRILDRESGLRFRAYCGASGPGYATERGLGTFLGGGTHGVLETFERWIAATSPADCEIRFESGSGIARAGARGGVPFDHSERTSIAEGARDRG
jgi:hypothetical protein